MIYELRDPAVADHLFANSTDTVITSALQGIMGKVYADDLQNPTGAMIFLNVFVFFAGEPNEELLQYKPDSFNGDFAVFVPQNEEWEACIERVWADKTEKFSRYAIKKEPDVFDVQKLTAFTQEIPKSVTLQLIDKNLYTQCLQNEWSKDFVCNYKNADDFLCNGLGVVAVENGQVIAGASSFSNYNGGIEIEIVTHEDHRRRGLATAVGAKLILECLKRGLYPNWDAATKISVALAEKLGYHFSHEYTAYRICPYV